VEEGVVVHGVVVRNSVVWLMEMVEAIMEVEVAF
jgi:hypothetical protein